MTEPTPQHEPRQQAHRTSTRSRLRRVVDARLFVVVAVAAALRLYGLGAESLWTDELITWGFLARYSALELVYVIPTSQPHLPLYYVLMDLWMGVFGSSEEALRFPAAIFGIASVALCYLLGSRLFDRNAGFVAALLLAVSRFHVQHSMEVRMYTLFTMLALASTLLYARLRATDDMRTAGGYVVATYALILTHPFAVFVPLAHAVFHVVDAAGSHGSSHRPDLAIRDWHPTRLAMVATWAAAGPVLAALVWKTSGIEYHYVTAPSLQHIGNTLAILVGLENLPTLVIAVGLLVVFGLAGFAVVREYSGTQRVAGFSHPFGPAVLLVACVAAPLVCNLLLSVAFTPLFWPRYVIAAGPPLFLLTGAGVSGLAGTLSSTDSTLGSVRSGAAVLAVVLVCALFVMPVFDLHTTTEREQWREAGATVDANAQPGDAVLVADAISLEGMQHYVDSEAVTLRGVYLEESGTGRDADTNAEIREKAAGHDRVWLTVSHASDAEQERVVEALSKERTVVDHWSLVGVDLYLLDRPSSSASVDDSREAVAAHTARPS
jgi:mannosyltransferase